MRERACPERDRRRSRRSGKAKWRKREDGALPPAWLFRRSAPICRLDGEEKSKQRSTRDQRGLKLFASTGSIQFAMRPLHLLCSTLCTSAACRFLRELLSNCTNSRDGLRD